jgi:hypothetical protein
MILFTVKPPLCYTAAMAKSGKETRDFLFRGLPVEVADKLKVAASLHRKPMREYLLDVVEAHLKELERKGITLTLPKGK